MHRPTGSGTSNQQNGIEDVGPVPTGQIVTVAKAFNRSVETQLEAHATFSQLSSPGFSLLNSTRIDPSLLLKSVQSSLQRT